MDRRSRPRPIRAIRGRTSTSCSISDRAGAVSRPGLDQYVKVGKVGDFPRDRGRLVRAGDTAVAVFRVGERWFALRDACPHMGASLADGKLDDLRVTCGWHGWKFDLRDGQGDRHDWARARVHEIKIETDDVLVGPALGPDPPPPSSDDEDWVAFDPDRHIKKP